MACEIQPKSVVKAYLWWFPLGLFGAHRLYLRNYVVGYIYMFTLGCLGFGWIFDSFFIPAMVKEANDRLEKDAEPKQCHGGCSEVGLRYGPDLQHRNVRDALILLLNPIGFFGKQPCKVAGRLG